MVSFKVALAQTSPVSAPPGLPNLSDPNVSPFPALEANLASARDYVHRAKKGGAHIVVFPEYFLQGIVNDSRQYLTFPSNHLIGILQDLAKSHEISIVGTIVHGILPPGTAQPPYPPFPTPSPFTADPKARAEWVNYLRTCPHKIDTKPVLHNTAFFIDSHGEVLGEYIKRNLWHPEREYLTAGTKGYHVFDTSFGRVGMMICWDMSHPAAAQDMVKQGVDIVFAPTYWTATDSEPVILRHPHPADYELQVIQALSHARAFETECIWIMVNAGGKASEGFAGGSGVWAPLRGKIGGLGGEEGLEFVDVDMDLLKDARGLYKIKEDASKRDAT